jgi:hypothetical protein
MIGRQRLQHQARRQGWSHLPLRDIPETVSGIIMSKTHPLGFRIERDLKEALVKAAKDDHRSVSSMVEIIIARWLRDRGYLVEKEERAA